MSRFLSQKQVCEKTNLSRTTIWRRQHDGTFPKRKRLTSNRVAWLERDIEEWIESRGDAE